MVTGRRSRPDISGSLPSLEALTFLLPEVLTRMSSGCAYIRVRPEGRGVPPVAPARVLPGRLSRLPPAAPRRRGRSLGGRPLLWERVGLGGGGFVGEVGRFACHPVDLPSDYHTGSRGPPCRCWPLGRVAVGRWVGLGAAPLIRCDRA